MKIILRTAVPNLGRQGDVKTVSDGYARNFLFPKKLAEPATPEREAEAERLRQQKRSRDAGEVGTTFTNLKELSLKEVVLYVKANQKGTLFSGVTSAMLSAILLDKGVQVKPAEINIPQAIKHLGTHTIEVRSKRGGTVALKVVVAAQK